MKPTAFPVPRNFIEVAGPDAATYLQGQLSQDIDRIVVGDGGAWSYLLQPQGKVVALLRVTRLSGDRFVLDTDEGSGPLVVERLNRFKLRVACSIEVLPWTCVALRGRDFEAAPDAMPDAMPGDVSSGAVAARAGWPVHDGIDLLGPDPKAPPGFEVGTAAAFEALRIEAGWPRMGAELDERTIPAEAGALVIERSVSFTKGCYTGQELVARIDSRGGNVPRQLRLLWVDGDQVPSPGAALTVDGNDAGIVTSAAWSAGLGRPVALALVPRAVSPPTDGRVTWEDGAADAEVRALPDADRP